jgi:predicted membrane protein
MTEATAPGSTEPSEGRQRHGVWWRPDRVSWWMGLLFAVGSLCFALAAIVSQWASAPRPAIGVTYFVGSIFFTVAAYLQWRSAARAPRGVDWWASAIQLAGTLFFNVSTFAGMKHGFDARQTNLRVWTPDVFGSICFLVSSELAYAKVCHRWFCIRARSLSWRIAALNLVGSIAFGVSAVTSLIEPSTQEPVSAAIANAGTAIGALCFLAGAVMLVPEAAQAT